MLYSRYLLSYKRTVALRGSCLANSEFHSINEWEASEGSHPCQCNCTSYWPARTPRGLYLENEHNEFHNTP